MVYLMYIISGTYGGYFSGKLYKDENVENGDILINGTFKYLDGSIYTGSFENNIPHGQGTFTYVNGDQFVGKFIQGELNEGILTCVNGIIYNGLFINDKFCSGRKDFPSGDYHVGRFIKDQIHGQSKQYFANGDFFDGYSDHGKMMFGEYYNKSLNIKGTMQKCIGSEGPDGKFKLDTNVVYDKATGCIKKNGKLYTLKKGEEICRYVAY